VVAYPPYLRKTLGIALGIGALLFAINHLDVVIRGDSTLGVWVKGAVTCLVPFTVSNIGILIACRRPDGAAPSERS
jgi:hypothetical protein